MSAFLCNDYHISVLAQFAYRHGLHGLHEGAQPDQIGAVLHAENVASVNYRYNEASAPAFKFDARAIMGRAVSMLQIIKAARCLDYQSCEHPGWEDSKAKRMLDRIVVHATHLLPGYDEAQWELPTPNTPAVTIAPVR